MYDLNDVSNQLHRRLGSMSMLAHGITENEWHQNEQGVRRIRKDELQDAGLGPAAGRKVH